MAVERDGRLMGPPLRFRQPVAGREREHQIDRLTDIGPVPG